MIGKSSCLSTCFIGSYHHFYIITVVIDYNHGDLPIINLPMKP